MSVLVKRLRAWQTPGETITGDVQLYLDAADRIEALEAALRIIAGYEQCIDNLMSNQNIAIAALAPETKQ
jgi:hypothetical protein